MSRLTLLIVGVIIGQITTGFVLENDLKDGEMEVYHKYKCERVK